MTRMPSATAARDAEARLRATAFGVGLSFLPDGSYGAVLYEGGPRAAKFTVADGRIETIRGDDAYFFPAGYSAALDTEDATRGFTVILSARDGSEGILDIRPNTLWSLDVACFDDAEVGDRWCPNSWRRHIAGLMARPVDSHNAAVILEALAGMAYWHPDETLPDVSGWPVPARGRFGARRPYSMGDAR